MKIFRCFVATMILAMMAFTAPSLSYAQGYDPEAPCGRDARGLPMQCTAPDGSANIESTCLTQARVEICLPYHKTSCEIRGAALACRVYNIGVNCYGGDPQLCNLYQQLLFANRACTLDNDQNACNFLNQNLN